MKLMFPSREFDEAVAAVCHGSPAGLEIISPNEASCGKGRLTAEVLPPASGFRIGTPLATVTDLGTSFGLDVQNRRTELHVFKGSVEWQEGAGTAEATA